MNTPRVLLVDDNEKLRELYKLGLEGFGHMSIVGEAGNGREGIDAARALRPDIILLDLSMPTMDGLEALGPIRAASPGSHVLVLTGFRRDRLQPLAKELGATAFLEKGLSPTELAAAVRAATARPPPPFEDLPHAAREALLERVRELV